ncbi:MULTISPECIES: DUF1329 domain-containing protein [unclassified Pseudomonas]|uniref:DUF1329 domain-containing protein n=1 Tax=unclassified Pseudomonas TaxID=196821 RepID=UPI000A1DBE64|nr:MULTISPECIES: DUF1329 domain-containing protein [unclassified Pseudomonas]
MTMTTLRAATVAACLAVSLAPAAWADDAGLTCVGAQKAGNADGSIPAYSGKWLGVPDTVKFAGTGNYWQDPYADEKPLAVITAQNMAQYADNLTPGQQALLKKYPDTFKIPVYPSHRDFRYPDWVCESAKANAKDAKVVDGGEGIVAIAGAVPFPEPKSGIELFWNFNNTSLQPWTEASVQQQAVVYPDGNIAWGEVDMRCLSPRNDPNVRRKTDSDEKPYGGVNSWCFVKTLLPQRDKGSVLVAGDYFNYLKRPRDAYQYNPGTRRVRQLPSFGFDMPQGPGGFRTVDDDHLFNGSPERYEWKIAGKKEIFTPWNSYRIHQSSVTAEELLKTKGHINTERMRFEKQRVWVLEGTLKPGYRHQYAKRVIYVNEDTWAGVMADEYDSRGQLWRTVLTNWLYAYEVQGYYYGIAAHQDLTSGAYLVDRITTTRGGPKLNAGGMTPAMFTPEAAARAGR